MHSLHLLTLFATLLFVKWQIKDLSRIPMGALIFGNQDYWRPSTT